MATQRHNPNDEPLDEELKNRNASIPDPRKPRDEPVDGATDITDSEAERYKLLDQDEPNSADDVSDDTGR